MRFTDRRDAGRQLGALLGHLVPTDPIVVGLPRGGVPVAYEVALALSAPLEVLVVRKLGCPGQPELGIGALGEGGVRLLNEALVAATTTTIRQIEKVTRRERAELEERVHRYRGERAPMPVDGRAVIIVDDGLATGFTARAAAEILVRLGAQRLVIAVPVASDRAIADMNAVADEVVVVHVPSQFGAVGEFYDDFTQISDDEVVALLSASMQDPG
ncbi:MAG: phosphoribosyltransferase family protein [Nitriliruptoraceae bacterium]